MVSGFTILLLFYHFRTVPESLMEAARPDGAGDFTIFTRVFLPVSKPGLAAVGLFQIVGTWNQFREPLLYITDGTKITIQIALRAVAVVDQSGTGYCSHKYQNGGGNDRGKYSDSSLSIYSKTLCPGYCVRSDEGMKQEGRQYLLEGSLRPQDTKTFHRISLQVGDNCRSIGLRFSYGPREETDFETADRGC
mgnify:CR=1 FL=1